MLERIYTTENFRPVLNGNYKTNIPNIESIAYRHEVPNGMVEKLDTSKRFLLRITTWEKFDSVNTAVDFSVNPTYKVGELKNANGDILYGRIAVARGRTSGEISYCVGWDGTQLTFSALPSGTTETVDVFYLLNEGHLRFQMTSPAQATRSNIAIMQNAISGINLKNQYNINDSLYFTGDFNARSGFKYEFAITSRAPIFFDPADTGENIGTGWNDIAIIEFPYISEKEAVLQETNANVTKATNSQFNRT